MRRIGHRVIVENIPDITSSSMNMPVNPLHPAVRVSLLVLEVM
jgi:hypothetical protein